MASTKTTVEAAKGAAPEGKGTELFQVDLSKPLVFQVGHLLDRYDEWVHKPVVSKNGPRLFESDFMESLTNTHWWMIPVIWLPVVVYAEMKALSLGVPPAILPIYMAIGGLIWSLLEYCLHRFLFHWVTKTYWTNTLHYLLHGCHHKHPQDPYRLVFPPALCCVFIAAIVPPFTVVFPMTLVWAAFGGGLLGYILYDITHFWVHFGLKVKIPPVSSMRTYHMGHHFKNPDVAFGITSPLWDYVFGTHPSATKEE